MIGSPRPPALQLDGVSVHVDGVCVLEDLYLRVEADEVIAIQGPSGAGKSTLLATIAGLIRPGAGQVLIEGMRVDNLSDRARSAHRLERLGVVFQTDELLPELSLGENITLPLQLTGRRRRAAELLREAESLVDHLGIADLMDRSPNAVSGGQLQRAAIARSLIHRPSLVLADEPTASLDDASARTAVQLLIRLAKERRTAAVLVTHDSAVASLCDRTWTLNDGKIEEAPATAQLA